MYRIFKYLNKKTKFYTLIGSLANGGILLAQPMIVSRALSLDQGDLTYYKIVQFTIYGFTVYFILYSLMLFCNHTRNVFRREIQINIRTALFKKLLASDEFSEDEKITILTQDMEYLGDNYLERYVNIISYSFMAVVAVCYIIFQDAILGSVFVFFTILRPIPQLIMNSRLKYTGDEISVGREAVHNQVSDSIRGARTLINNQAVVNNRQRFFNVNMKYQKAIQKFCFTHNVIFYFNGFMLFLSQVIPLVLGFYFAMNGQQVSVASLVAMYIAAGQLVGPIQNIMYDVVEVQGAQTTADKIFGILNRPDEGETDGGAISHVQELEIAHLSKSYNGRELFHDLNLHIHQGEKVLIKGPSGCGKSTLFRLITGEETPDVGTIMCRTVDGQESTQFTSQVGMISQHPFLFNDSIRYNLTLGQTFSEEELLAVLKQVKLDQELVDGLDFQVVNNGENISGGQRVRLELARFLLRKKDILLADEVTAALDAENGQMVRDLLFSLPMMVLEIAHHIDDESRYDQIVELRRD